MTHLIPKLIGFSAALIVSAIPANACSERDAAIAAINNQDLDTAASIHTRIILDPNCDDPFREWLNRSLARETFRAAMNAPDATTKKELYAQSKDYAPHWRTHVALADLAEADGDHGAEALELQLAINLLADETYTDNASSEEIEALVQRASQAMLLADAPVTIPRTRSGAIGGIFATNIRGFESEEIDLAIRFKFDSAEMTKDGLIYAEQLLEHVTSLGLAEIVLEGHTDPQGDEKYNLELSKKRAAALRAYLKSNGFEGKVITIGKGESEPPEVSGDIEEDSEEHYRIARRVVFVRS